MSNEGQLKVSHKNRTLTLQELAEGKSWNISTNRYRTRKEPDMEKTIGLLYLTWDNTYKDLNKKGYRTLQHQQERELGIVWHAELELYCPKTLTKIKISRIEIQSIHKHLHIFQNIIEEERPKRRFGV